MNLLMPATISLPSSIGEYFICFPRISTCNITHYLETETELWFLEAQDCGFAILPLFLQVSPPSLVPVLNAKHLRTGTAAAASSTQHREMPMSFIKILGTILNNGGVGSQGRRKAHKPLLYAQVSTSQSAGRGKQGSTTMLNLTL